MNIDQLIDEVKCLKERRINNINRLDENHPDYWYNYYLASKHCMGEIAKMITEYQRKLFEESITN